MVLVGFGVFFCWFWLVLVGLVGFGEFWTSLFGFGEVWPVW